MHSLINFYKMNKYIYLPEQETGIIRISEAILTPNLCIPQKITSFIFYHHKLVLPAFNPYVNRSIQYVPLVFISFT